MKKSIFYILFCFGLFFSQNSYGQVFDKNELEIRIDDLIPKGVNDSTPGLVIGIVSKGELIFSKGYGLANLSYGIPNDPQMVYNIGSDSKQFLGYAFAMLHVKGILNIDDPINKYLEDWPEFKFPVTLRHLLTHTSGYREAYTMSNLAGRIIGVDLLSREECLNVVRKQPQLEFIPGSQWRYNSTAYVILAEILEQVTGQPADEWVEKNILQPLGMNNTQIESYVGEVIHNAAESYSYEKDKGYINPKSNRAIFGAAEVYTSIDDLVKWINNYRTAKIGGKAVNNLFLNPFLLNDGINSEYALGIENSSYRGLKRYRHTGSHEAFATQISYFPDQDLGIIAISNFGDNGWMATTKIADLLLKDYMTLPKTIENQQLEKEKLEQFAGLYVATTLNRTINLTLVADTLTIGGRTKLIPTSQNTFGIKESEVQFQFKNLSNGKTQLTIVNGTDQIFTSAVPWAPNIKDLTPFEGDYWSDELETVYHLNVKENKLTIQHRWLGEISLEPIAKDFFKTDWAFYIEFNRDEEGNISSLSVNSGRTLNVIFHRKI